MNWYIKVLQNYATFSGRARRKEYWMFFLINFIISLVLGAISAFAGFDLLSNIYSLVLFIPSIAVAARRMHDIGKSGWLLLIGLIPLIGIILLIIWFVKEGDTGPNEYGPDPKADGDLSDDISSFGEIEQDVNTENA